MQKVYFWTTIGSFFWNSALYLCSLNFLITTTCTLWYFDKEKIGKEKNENCSKAFKWMAWYHFGSVALSSLIIGLFWILQLLMKILIASLKGDDKAGENCCMIC